MHVAKLMGELKNRGTNRPFENVGIVARATVRWSWMTKIKIANRTCIHSLVCYLIYFGFPFSPLYFFPSYIDTQYILLSHFPSFCCTDYHSLRQLHEQTLLTLI